jgi:hypothetical protein
MEETGKKRWLLILFFMTIGALFVGFIYFTLFGDRDPRYRRLEESASSFKASRAAAPDPLNIRLTRDQAKTVGNLRLVYHGCEDAKVIISVTISELDPEVAYRHRIPLQEARAGVRLGGQPFKVVSAGKSELHLVRAK